MANDFTELLDPNLPEHALRQLAELDVGLLFYLVFGLLAVIGAWINKRKEAGKPLSEADKALLKVLSKPAWKGNIEAIKQHLADGADVNAKDEDGETPLDLAIRHQRTEFADLLRKHGGKHSTIHAAANGNIEAVKQYLDGGADVNAKDGGGWTPLHRAADYGHKEIAELLIANGADVNAKDDGGMTPLHRTAEMDHKEIVELLIAAGADVNAKDDRGSSLLHEVGTKEVVELLIAAGADVNAKGDFGRTPLDDADGETADLLRKHGGKTGEELKAEGK